MIRPIIVFYVNVSNVSRLEMNYVLESYKNSLKNIPEDEYISIIFPNFERHEVVCLNPNIVSEQTYLSVLGDIEEFQKKFNSIKTHITNESERKDS
jgi:hypothetical protein